MKSNQINSTNNFWTKFHFFQFQKWPKINFRTGKKFKTAKNAISQKNDLFDFPEFFCLDFFKFSGPLRYNWIEMKKKNSLTEIFIKNAESESVKKGKLDVT